MSDIVKDVGFRIRELREERGLTQEKLAALADLHRTLTDLETPPRSPRMRGV